MPCRVDDTEHAAEEARTWQEVGESLCEAVRKHPELRDDLRPRARRWLDEHQERERERAIEFRERQARERLKHDAWKKLTPEERKALGCF